VTVYTLTDDSDSWVKFFTSLFVANSVLTGSFKLAR